jgi:hypothetical protein
MGVVVVKCPVTGRPFSTGIQVEREDFEALQQDSMTTSRCPIVDWNTFGGRGKLDASMPSLPTMD